MEQADASRRNASDATSEIAPAIVYVDGQEFIRCQAGDNFNHVFDETVASVGGEVALMVWKPRHDGYLRTRLSVRRSEIGA